MDKMVYELKSIEIDNPFPYRDSDKKDYSTKGKNDSIKTK
jgi:hypothetical protein